jgi:dinuclear metal center YbgI/SA1388 family protein
VAEKVTPFSLEGNEMTATVADIIRVLEEIAPTKLAESWDNPGLQVGDHRWQVKIIMISLDPTPGVMKHAAEMSIDMLVTHHPLIFRPIKSLDLSTPIGDFIGTAIRNSIAVYAAHTNFDSVANGLNDMLAACLDLKNVKVLAPTEGDMSTDTSEESINGLGRIGELERPTDLLSLCGTLKQALGLETVRIAGHTAGMARRVALCTGSGTSLLDRFFHSGADVFITGDVRYHDARDAEDRQAALIDIGHFGSEHIMVAKLGDRLREMLAARYADVEVIDCDIEKDPFALV